MSSQLPPDTPDLLDDAHKHIFERALLNLLSSDAAERTYAQILDGLPTEQSLDDSYVFMKGHPVYELKHTQICEGFLEKAREFRAQFNISQLRFEKSLLRAYQNTKPNTEAFNLRLIELVVVACHHIGAYLYELDDGAHKHQVHQDWREKELPNSNDGKHKRGYLLPHTAFFHRAYQYPDQYPRGLADVAGYWAEGKIFGGVVVFNRGESEEECNEMWIHGAYIQGPTTLYPPTEEQFKALISFLLADPEHMEEPPSPLPIHGTSANRPRWSPYDALAEYHIFRDRYERSLPSERPQRGCVIKNINWPEVDDESYIFLQEQAGWQGEPVDEEGLAAAKERLKNITPSSPLWDSVYGQAAGLDKDS
ncbi:Fc.00g080040.m01.CDS01 [Cosmosporella sp. VM-42]